MRKLFHTTAALSALMATSMAANAADVTARPAPYAPPAPVYAPPPFTWTGFYLGGNIGAQRQGHGRRSQHGGDMAGHRELRLRSGSHPETPLSASLGLALLPPPLFLWQPDPQRAGLAFVRFLFYI